MKRRQFLRASALTGSMQLNAAPASAESPEVWEKLPKLGPKPVVRDKTEVCSSSHPLVTQTMLDILREGGNAVDAAVAGAMMSATVEPHMTNHGGTVNVLYWDARSKRAYQMLSSGTLVPGL